MGNRQKQKGGSECEQLSSSLKANSDSERTRDHILGWRRKQATFDWSCRHVDPEDVTQEVVTGHLRPDRIWRLRRKSKCDEFMSLLLSNPAAFIDFRKRFLVSIEPLRKRAWQAMSLYRPARLYGAICDGSGSVGRSGATFDFFHPQCRKGMRDHL